MSPGTVPKDSPLSRGVSQRAHGAFPFADHSDVRAEDTHRRFRIGTDDPPADHGDDFRVDLPGGIDHILDFMTIEAQAPRAHDVDMVGQQGFPQNGMIPSGNRDSKHIPSWEIERLA